MDPEEGLRNFLFFLLYELIKIFIITNHNLSFGVCSEWGFWAKYFSLVHNSIINHLEEQKMKSREINKS